MSTFFLGLPTGLLIVPTKGGALPEGGKIISAVFFTIGPLTGTFTVKLAGVAVDATDSPETSLSASPAQN